MQYLLAILLLVTGFVFFYWCGRRSHSQGPPLDVLTEMDRDYTAIFCNGNIEAICSVIHECHIVDVPEQELFARILDIYFLYWTKCGYLEREGEVFKVKLELPPMSPKAELELFWVLRGKMENPLSEPIILENINRSRHMLYMWLENARKVGRHSLQRRGLIERSLTGENDGWKSPELTSQGRQAVTLLQEHIQFLSHEFSIEQPGNPADWNVYITEAILFGFSQSLSHAIDMIDPQYFTIEWGMSYEEWLDLFHSSDKIAKNVAAVVLQTLHNTAEGAHRI